MSAMIKAYHDPATCENPIFRFADETERRESMSSFLDLTNGIPYLIEIIDGTIVLIEKPPAIFFLCPALTEDTEERREFNYRVSRARIIVECCIALLKMKWRRLHAFHIKEFLKIVPHIILHNICIDAGDVDEDARKTLRLAKKLTQLSTTYGTAKQTLLQTQQHLSQHREHKVRKYFNTGLLYKMEMGDLMII